jgi:hypothetical protein
VLASSEAGQASEAKLKSKKHEDSDQRQHMNCDGICLQSRTILAEQRKNHLIEVTYSMVPSHSGEGMRWDLENRL